MPFRPYLALPSLVSCRSPLAVTADKAYDSEKVRQRIMDEGVLPVMWQALVQYASPAISGTNLFIISYHLHDCLNRKVCAT